MIKLELSRSWIVPILCLIMTGYFIFHAIQGARGYRRMNQIKTEIVLARQIADEVHERKELLAHKVQALSPESLDLDLLQESAARLLNMGPKEDRIILIP